MAFPFITPYLNRGQRRAFELLVVVSVVLNVALWIVTWRFFPLNSPAAILHYSIDVGIDFIGEGKHIVALPLIGAIIIFFNTVLGVAMVRADTRAAWVLWSAVPVVQIILGIALGVLWRANL